MDQKKLLIWTLFTQCQLTNWFPRSGNQSSHESKHIFLLVETTFGTSGNTYPTREKLNCFSKGVINVTTNETLFITKRASFPLLKIDLLDCGNKCYCL